jgi:aldehyde:ferredoxin oxidoreductase
MNAMIFGIDIGKQDWIPDRAIGPTDDNLYEAEKDYNDSELSRIMGKPLDEIRKMATAEKREALMKYRKEQLTELIREYYRERGWTETGIPTVDTLKNLGLWQFLNEDTKTWISER